MTRLVLFGGHGFVGSALRAGLPPEDLVAPSRRDVDLADESSVRAFLEPGDAVVNAAGYAAATDRTADGLARFRRDNVEAVRCLADAAIDRGVARLIHLSSVAAMGQRSGTGLVETDLATPRSPYGQSKRDGELVLEARGDRLPITILRPTSIFGPGRGLARLLCRIAALPVVPLPAGGRAMIPFSHIDNLVGAVVAAIGTPATAGRTFIVGDPESYRLRDVLVGLAARLGQPAPRTVSLPVSLLRAVGALEAGVAGLRGARPLLDPVRLETLTVSVSYSPAAFQAVTGFQPPVDLGAALDDLAAWYLDRPA